MVASCELRLKGGLSLRLPAVGVSTKAQGWPVDWTSAWSVPRRRRKTASLRSRVLRARQRFERTTKEPALSDRSASTVGRRRRISMWPLLIGLPSGDHNWATKLGGSSSAAGRRSRCQSCVPPDVHRRAVWVVRGQFNFRVCRMRYWPGFCDDPPDDRTGPSGTVRNAKIDGRKNRDLARLLQSTFVNLVAWTRWPKCFLPLVVE